MKLAIVVRKDLGMRTGKIAVQVGHASVEAYRIANGTDDAERWYEEGQKKIVLKCADRNQLLGISTIAQMMGLMTLPIIDFGLTQVPENTLTCIAIGPDEDHKIDEVTKGLSLL